MLAHSQGQLLNAARLARGLAVDGKTVARRLDLMADLLLVRRLPPCHGNAAKRQAKSPKAHIRDSGLVHALLGLDSRESVLGHPVAGDSWEGFAVEDIMRAASERTRASFLRTAAVADIDLLLELPDRRLRAIEIKRGLSPKPERGFHHAREDLNPDRSLVVHSGDNRRPKTEGVEAIGLNDPCREVNLAQFALRPTDLSRLDAPDRGPA